MHNIIEIVVSLRSSGGDFAGSVAGDCPNATVPRTKTIVRMPMILFRDDMPYRYSSTLRMISRIWNGRPFTFENGTASIR